MIRINLTFDRFRLWNPIVAGIIKQCIRKTLELEHVDFPCEINVLVTDNNGIQSINKASRNIDAPTDVLSFPMFELEPGKLPEDYSGMLDAETGLCPLGDMAISLERAVAQSREYGHSVRREIGYLTIHSMLHLLGYDHMDEGVQKKQMRSREKAIAASVPGLKR